MRENILHIFTKGIEGENWHNLTQMYSLEF